MTWEKLKQEAKDMGYCCYGKIYEKLTNGKYIFLKGGHVFFKDKNQLVICFTTDRDCDQMYAIMKALQRKESK